MNADTGHEPYDSFVSRLSASSVRKHYDAYTDVDWDHPDHRIDPDDPRFELGDDEPLAETAWYRALPPSTRAQIGLFVVASRMKTGIAFEGILSRGLLELAATAPNDSSEFRYAYHEVIEESQHSLMFHEFIRRSGQDVRGLAPLEALFARRVPRFGRVFPERFFLHVLAGEAPIDWIQRRLLASTRPQHPLLRRITQIHVLEEARHVCFAQRYLEEHVPRLGWFKKLRLRLWAPVILAGTAQQMMRTPGDLVDAYRIPATVVAEAAASSRHRTRLAEGLAPVREVCEKIGLVTPQTRRLWQWCGV